MSLPKETLVRVNRLVVSGAEHAYYVAHRRDGSWDFQMESDTGSDEQMVASTIDGVLAIDASLEEVLDLNRGWHAWRHAPDSTWQRAEIPFGPTFYFQFETVPSPDNPDRHSFQGALINCWVRGGLNDACEHRAREEVVSAGWTIKTLEDSAEVTREDFELDSTGQERFDQAQIDGMVLEINTWEEE